MEVEIQSRGRKVIFSGYVNSIGDNSEKIVFKLDDGSVLSFRILFINDKEDSSIGAEIQSKSQTSADIVFKNFNNSLGTSITDVPLFTYERQHYISLIVFTLDVDDGRRTMFISISVDI